MVYNQFSRAFSLSLCPYGGGQDLTFFRVKVPLMSFDPFVVLTALLTSISKLFSLLEAPSCQPSY